MNDQYLKMVRTLPGEFFKDWEYKIGDEVLIDSKRYIIYGKNSIKMYAVSAADEDFAMAKIDFKYEDGKGVLPIPNQRQLQDMIIKKQRKFKEVFSLPISQKINDGWLLHIFNDYIEFRSPSVYNIKFEDFWLMLVMFVLYENEWDGETWI